MTFQKNILLLTLHCQAIYLKSKTCWMNKNRFLYKSSTCICISMLIFCYVDIPVDIIHITKHVQSNVTEMYSNATES